jgi:DNA-binding HxlR family transcriptional regulator
VYENEILNMLKKNPGMRYKELKKSIEKEHNVRLHPMQLHRALSRLEKQGRILKAITASESLRYYPEDFCGKIPPLNKAGTWTFSKRRLPQH